MTPQEVLDRGLTELTPVLGPAGFEFIDTGGGFDGAGQFASGEFLRDDRRLELNVRSSLSLVRYHIGDVTLSHEEFVWAVRGLNGMAEKAEYPGFSADPAASFRHLRHDLERFGAVFLTGGAKAFRATKKWLDKHPRKTGLAGLGA